MTKINELIAACNIPTTADEFFAQQCAAGQHVRPQTFTSIYAERHFQKCSDAIVGWAIASLETDVTDTYGDVSNDTLDFISPIYRSGNKRTYYAFAVKRGGGERVRVTWNDDSDVQRPISAVYTGEWYDTFDRGYKMERR